MEAALRPRREVFIRLGHHGLRVVHYFVFFEGAHLLRPVAHQIVGHTGEDGTCERPDNEASCVFVGPLGKVVIPVDWQGELLPDDSAESHRGVGEAATRLSEHLLDGCEGYSHGESGLDHGAFGVVRAGDEGAGLH